MMIDWILCLLGIIVYFLKRFQNRKEKNRVTSFAYWIKDNWPELTTSVIFNLALMIILHLPQTTVDLAPIFDQLPFVLKVAGMPTISFLLGLGLTNTFYSLFKQKIK